MITKLHELKPQGLPNILKAERGKKEERKKKKTCAVQWLLQTTITLCGTVEYKAAVLFSGPRSPQKAHSKPYLNAPCEQVLRPAQQ